MATAESVKAKIQGLIDSANTTTGSADADLTTAVGSLIAGFGQGGGGGLPAGITALTSGTFTPASDAQSAYAVTHGLGVTPNFFVVTVEGQQILNPSDFNYYITHEYGLVQRFMMNTNTLEAFRMYRYSNGSAFAQAGANSLASLVANKNSFNVYASSTYSLKAGVTYRWIAGVVDGI